MGQPLSATGEAGEGAGVVVGLRRLAADAVDMLFPPRCVLCGIDLLPGASALPAGLCAPCAFDLRHPAVAPGGGGAGTCGGEPGECAYLGPYDGPLREAVLRCKRPSGVRVSAALAELLTERHGEQIRAWAPDLVVPVPMHWTRRVRRGTSAAADLARGLGRAVGVPFADALRRRRATVMQNRLPVERRRGNVAGAIGVRRPVTGRRVLLVDDVVTTGATVAACRAALLGAGATAVAMVAVARARASDA